jgi:hypothetical protein
MSNEYLFNLHSHEITPICTIINNKIIGKPNPEPKDITAPMSIKTGINSKVKRPPKDDVSSTNRPISVIIYQFARFESLYPSYVV